MHGWKNPGPTSTGVKSKSTPSLSPLAPASYPQVGVELVQHQAHGAGQVADVGRLLVQGVLEHLKVLHPLHGEAVVDDVRLQVKVKSQNRLYCQFQQNVQDK